MDWMLPLRFGLVTGLVLGLAFTLALLVGHRLSPDFMVQDYPPAIRARYGPKSARGRRVVVGVGIALYAVIVTALVASILGLRASLGGALAFGPVWLATLTAFVVANLYDLLVLDWLIFVTLRPAFVVLPGTEGMAEYGDLAFHVRGFLIGVVGSLVVSLIVSGIVVALEAIT